MTIIQLQILTTFLTILWFDFFGLHRTVLKWFGHTAWIAKDDLPWYEAWAACYFCTSFWMGVGVAIGTAISQTFMWNSIDFELLITFVMLNFVVARILDTLLGYDDIKGK